MVTDEMSAGEARPVGQIVTTTDQVIIDVNAAICELLDRDRADLIGTRALSFTFAEDLKRNSALLDRLAGSSGPSFAISKRYVRSDARLVWVRNHVSTVGDGTGGKLICATCEPTVPPFGSDVVSRRHAAALRLCLAFVRGKRSFGADLICAPPAEALLWLYRAELEGNVLSVDEIARLTSVKVSTMQRWVDVLLKRALIEHAGNEPLSGESTLRISRDCEVALDTLMAGLER